MLVSKSEATEAEEGETDDVNWVLATPIVHHYSPQHLHDVMNLPQCAGHVARIHFLLCLNN